MAQNALFTVKTIQFKYERKIALAKYESAALEASAWADVPYPADPEQALKELAIMIRQSLRTQAIPILAARNEGKEPDLEEAIADIATLTAALDTARTIYDDIEYKLLLIYREFTDKGVEPDLLAEFAAQFPDFLKVPPEHINERIEVMERMREDKSGGKNEQTDETLP
jgi:hypothetical protein